MTDVHIPPYHEHEFYYGPDPQHPIYLRSGVVYDVLRTEVVHEVWDGGPKFKHYVIDQKERAERQEALDAELAEVGRYD